MKLYLYQLAKWLEATLEIPQQIIHTKNNDSIRYTDYDSPDERMNMTLIVDADITVKSIAWSGEYGLGLNVDSISNENDNKLHVLLWSDSELLNDEHGYYMDIQSALDGVLVIQNPDIKLNGQIISEMQSLPKSEKLILATLQP